jgi:O-succinylbenzoic acid--CoA ligase
MGLRLAGRADDDIEAVAVWLAADDPGAVLVATSGSSGTPKQVVLSRAAVLASADASARRLGGSGRWLLALPSSYVAGLNVVVRSLLAGHRPEMLGDRSPREARIEGGFLSLVPTQLHRWLSEPEDAAALAALDTVLVGGGPVDASLRERAGAAGIRLVATYGMAETCGGCVYDGLPLDDVGLAVADDGRVRVSGPTLFDGYVDDPEATGQVLVDGWFHTSDAGRIGDDGRLLILGRMDDMVVSGGVNVPGPAVAARLRAHPRLALVEVLGVPDVEWGSRVVAIVVAEDAVPSLDELRDWVSEVHPRAWAPRELHVVPELPMLANGKVDRIALRALAGGER